MTTCPACNAALLVISNVKVPVQGDPRNRNSPMYFKRAGCRQCGWQGKYYSDGRLVKK